MQLRTQTMTAVLAIAGFVALGIGGALWIDAMGVHDAALQSTSGPMVVMTMELMALGRYQAALLAVVIGSQLLSAAYLGFAISQQRSRTSAPAGSG